MGGFSISTTVEPLSVENPELQTPVYNGQLTVYGLEHHKHTRTCDGIGTPQTHTYMYYTMYTVSTYCTNMHVQVQPLSTPY